MASFFILPRPYLCRIHTVLSIFFLSTILSSSQSTRSRTHTFSTTSWGGVRLHFMRWFCLYVFFQWNMFNKTFALFFSNSTQFFFSFAWRFCRNGFWNSIFFLSLMSAPCYLFFYVRWVHSFCTWNILPLKFNWVRWLKAVSSEYIMRKKSMRKPRRKHFRKQRESTSFW